MKAEQYNLTDSEIREMFISAFRYALGRRTYVVFDTVRMMLNNWDKHSDHDKQLFKREIEEAIERDMAGDSCDVYEWLRIVARCESE